MFGVLSGFTQSRLAQPHHMRYQLQQQLLALQLTTPSILARVVRNFSLSARPIMLVVISQVEASTFRAWKLARLPARRLLDALMSLGLQVLHRVPAT
jgi:hypothetical protein